MSWDAVGLAAKARCQKVQNFILSTELNLLMLMEQLLLILVLIQQNWRHTVDPDKFKSVAINIKTYQLLEELSQKRFELPISMSKTVEFYVQKGHEDFKGKDAKKKS